MKNRSFFILALAWFALFSAQANTKHDEHAPIDHCYHWLDEASEGYLAYKYSWAENNENELSFFTTPDTSNGSVAGPGLYCAKSPSGSYGYGDRVIRVDLVEDVVLYDALSGIQYCGTEGESSQTSEACGNKNWDIKFYNGGGKGNSAWYVIQNPMAVKAWSANSDVLAADLRASIEVNDTDFKEHANKTLLAMNAEKSTMGEHILYNANARLNLADIMLNDPAKLETMPPLNIVARLAQSNDERIDEILRQDTYKKYLLKALKSDEIDHKDFIKIASKNEDVRRSYYAMADLALGDSQKHNSLAILAAVADRANRAKQGKRLSPVPYAKLVDEIFANPYHLEALKEALFAQNPEIAQKVRQRLERPEKNPLNGLTGLINAYYPEEDAHKIKQMWLSTLFLNKGLPLILEFEGSQYFLDPSKSFQNQCDTMHRLLPNSSAVVTLRYHKNNLQLADLATVCQTGEKIVDALKELPEDSVAAHILTGRIETSPFVMVGAFYAQFSEQCSNFYQTLPAKNSVDEIYFSLNGSEEVKLYNEKSYWKTEEAVCHALMGDIVGQIPTLKLLEMKERSSQTNPDYIFEGKFEKQSFHFFGDSLEDIMEGCEEFYPSVINPAYVDEVFWSLNGSEAQREYNSNSYWRTKDGLCGKIKTVLSDKVPTKNILMANAFVERLKEQAQAKKPSYKVSGVFEGQEYFFYGNNRDEIKLMCSAFYHMVNNKKVDDLTWSVNGSESKPERNEPAYWDTRELLCSTLAEFISSKVPTKAQLEYQAELARLKAQARTTGAPHIISGNFNGQMFVFYGDNRDEIQLMCESFYPNLQNKDSIDLILYEINNGEQHRAYNRSSYWSDKTSLCSALTRELRASVPSLKEINGAALIRDWQAEAKQYEFVVNGHIDGQEFVLYGDTLGDALNKCEDFAPYILSQSIGHIELDVNGQNRENLSLYKARPDKVCANIAQLARTSRQKFILKNNIALAKNIFERSRAGAISDAKKVLVSDGQKGLYLEASNNRQLIDACENTYERLPFAAPSGDIDIKVDDKELPRTTIKEDYEGLSYCRQLGEILVFELPYKSLADQQREFEGSGAKHKISARINGVQAYFHGNNEEDLKEQCFDLYAGTQRTYEKVSLNWTVNEDKKDKSIELDNTTTEAACESFSQEALKGGFGRFLRGLFGGN